MDANKQYIAHLLGLQKVTEIIKTTNMTTAVCLAN